MDRIWPDSKKGAIGGLRLLKLGGLIIASYLIKYSEAEALQVIRAIVTCFVEKMKYQTPSQFPNDKISF
ncbi:hypothetical protein CCP4SC76_1920001 [Gammaproteobacteria bacterium]